MISLKSRNAIRIAKVITFLILLLFCLELSFIIYPPLLVLGLGVIGRSPLCSSRPSRVLKDINRSVRTAAFPNAVV
jgi:hypothetical protein